MTTIASAPTLIDDLRWVPDGAPAIIGPTTEVTFRGLRELIDEIAQRLSESGVSRGELVAVEVDRTAEAVASVLALWQLGAGYVPLDPGWPEAYRADLRALAGVRHVIRQSGTVEAEARDGDSLSTEWPCPAYGIFTSGTSGHRRCVLVGHQQVADLRQRLRTTVYADNAGQPWRVAMNGPLAFDTSVKQLVQILEGHALVLVPADLRADPAALRCYLHDHAVDVLDATPSMARKWLEHGVFESVRRLLLGGEPVDNALWKRLADAPNIQAWNLYGPTECTVDVIAAPVVGRESTLGEPMPGVTVTIEDPAGQPLPDFVVGEIVISGPAVALGYLGGEPGGFSERNGIRRYSTGDYGRRRRDGRVEFVGRRDTQVKVGGVRIDLCEVETAVAQADDVAGAAAALDSGGALVVAIEPRPGAIIDGTELRKQLASRLPAPMLPAAILVVDALPLTERGKLDRCAIAALRADLGGPAPPGLELTIAEAMADLLGGRPLERHESFFLRGGDSLSALELLGLLVDRTGLAVELADVLTDPTPAGIAAQLSDRKPPAPATSRRSGAPGRTLVEAIACGRLARVDAVAIGCIPDAMRRVLGSGDDLRELSEGLPLLAARRHLDPGSLGLILIPCFASEVASLGPELVLDAIAMGGFCGARVASLTGELGSCTTPGPRVGAVTVTSGQASTAAAMLETLDTALLDAARDISAQRVAVIGTNAIADAIVDDLRGRGVHTDEVVDATALVIAGAPAPGLDLSRVTPEVIVVEYGAGATTGLAKSAGLRAARVDGGSLAAPSLIADVVQGGAADEYLGATAASLDADRITACSLAGLLVALDLAPATVGPPTSADISGFRSAQAALGFTPRPLRLLP